MASFKIYCLLYWAFFLTQPCAWAWVQTQQTILKTQQTILQPQSRYFHEFQAQSHFHHKSQPLYSTHPDQDNKHVEIRSSDVAISFPSLSPTMKQGRISKWLKQEGDAINIGDTIMSVESDKADMDVEAFQSGILKSILVQEGEIANVGQNVAMLQTQEATTLPAALSSELSKQETTLEMEKPDTLSEDPKRIPYTSKVTAYEIYLHDFNGGMKEAQLVEWLKQPKEVFKVGDAIAIFKAGDQNFTLESSEPGCLAQHFFKPGDVVQVGEAIGEMVATSQDLEIYEQIKSTARTDSMKSDASKGLLSKKLNMHDGVSDPHKIPSNDIRPSLVKMNDKRRQNVRNKELSLKIPTFRVSAQVNLVNLINLANMSRSKGVSVTTLLIKAISNALKKHPVINAAFSDAHGGSIQYHHDINISVAAKSFSGALVAPILRKVSEKDIYTLAREWKELVNKSFENPNSATNLKDASFLLYNLGTHNVILSEFLLPVGIGAALSVGVSDDTDDRSSIMTLTADYRIIDEFQAARFIQDVVRNIEDDTLSLIL